MALRDTVAGELNAVEPCEQASDERLVEMLDAYRQSLAASWDRISAGKEDLLDAISEELDLGPDCVRSRDPALGERCRWCLCGRGPRGISGWPSR
jgi:hypothetical protein